MKHRILILLILSLLLTVPAVSAGCINVTETLLEFNGTDGVFTVYYDIEILPKIYIMAFGGANIVPEVEAQFTSFDKEDVTIKRLGYEQAVVVVKNVSFYEKGYYFHNPHNFGMNISKLVVNPPDKLPRTYLNANSTKSLFYKDSKLNGTLPSNNSILADFN
ncbi:MAG: hypothetical protein U9N36_08275 [Euryarchaeota archaeon]|nr:hypothetical protein [Euryarchaeota archaeon]